MKTIKLENRIIFFIVTFAIFILNFKFLTFLSLIIGSLLSFFLILLIDKFNLYKYKITKIIIFVFSIPNLIYYLNKISYYINDNILKEYSIIIISITLLITIYFLVIKGYHIIIKVILLSFYFLLFTLLIGIIITFPYINISNINFQMINSHNLILSIFIYTLSIIYCYFLIYPITKTKFLKKDIVISCLFHIIIFFIIYSILGLLTNYLKYPYIIIFKKVNLIGFIERIEIIFSLKLLFFFYYYLLLIFYQINYLLSLKIKKKKQLNITLLFLFFLIFLFSTLF